MINIAFSTALLHSILFQWTSSRRQRSLRFSTLQCLVDILKVTSYRLSSQRFTEYFRLLSATSH